jgi:hypothetical protein
LYLKLLQNNCINDSFGENSAMRSRLWLIVSLAFNVFAAVCLYVAIEPYRKLPPPPAPTYEDTLIKTNVVIRHENFTWDQVSSTNYVEFIKNLRAIGCPEQTIRDMVRSEIDRLYARRRVTEVVYPNYQWWRSDPDPDLVQAAKEKIQSLDTERRDLLTSLLGAGWDAESKAVIAARGGITLTGPVLGDMSAAAKEAVFIIIAAAQEKIEAYQEDQARQGKAADPTQIVRLREDPFVQLVTILTPAQYDEFVLRYSPGAQQLREEMRGLDLSADQFRELFNAVGAILGQPGYFYNGTDPQLLKQQQQLQAQSEALMKNTLPDVYAAYQLNQDPVYRSSKTTVEQLGVPAADVTPVYEINRATEAEMDRIRKDDTMSNDEKVEALAQTQVQQQESLEQVLGPDAFEHWLQLQEGK